MPIICVRDDITNLKYPVDTIVNSANTEPTYGSGLDRALYFAAGEQQLLAARKAVGVIPYGSTKRTGAYGRLAHSGVQNILHTVVPPWKAGDTIDFEAVEKVIAGCYRGCFHYKGIGFSRIAVPVLGTGSFGFPKQRGIEIALNEIAHFLMESEKEVTVYLVVYDAETNRLLQRVMPVEQVITDAYVAETWANQYPFAEYQPKEGAAPTAADKKFAYYLADYIGAVNEHWEATAPADKKHFTNASIAKRADLAKQTFSKIICGESIPKKETCCRIAIALGMNLAAARSLLEHAGHKWEEGGVWEGCIQEAIDRKTDECWRVTSIPEPVKPEKKS